MDQTSINRIGALNALKGSSHLLPLKDQEFVKSLVMHFHSRGLTDKQWYWVTRLGEQARSIAKDISSGTYASPESVSSPVRPTIALAPFAGVINLFKEVSKSLKNPRIVLRFTNGEPLHLKLSGSQSKHPGTVNVTDGRPYANNTWYGRVSPDGTWSPGPEGSFDKVSQAEVAALLTCLACDPVNTAAEHGKLTGMCCFCNSTLTDGKSTDAGYGPVCAKRWGLAWGNNKGTLACQ